jgi:D-alanine--poly(phosphoribitol) ligase subunit 2
MKYDPILIKEKIKAYIHQATHVEKEKIMDDSLFFKEGYLDSMGFIMLITFIEEEFAFNTSDADLIEENFESINAITSYILRKTENQ